MCRECHFEAYKCNRRCEGEISGIKGGDERKRENGRKRKAVEKIRERNERERVRVRVENSVRERLGQEGVESRGEGRE